MKYNFKKKKKKNKKWNSLWRYLMWNNLQDCFDNSNFFRYSIVQQNKTIGNYKFHCTNDVTNDLLS